MKAFLNKILAAMLAISKDRYAHFSFGAVIATLFCLAFCWLPDWASVSISAVTVIGCAVAKELWLDWKADWVDVIATLLGGVMVWVLVIVV